MFSTLVCAQGSESLACGCPKLPPFRPTCFGNSGLWFHDCGFRFSKIRYHRDSRVHGRLLEFLTLASFGQWQLSTKYMSTRIQSFVDAI